MIGLGLVVAVNLLLQFLLQWYVTVSSGVGIATDAFFGSLVLPQFILLVLGSSLTMVLVPMFSKDDGQTSHDYWTYLFLIGGLFFVVGLLLYVTCPWWTALIVPGLKATDHDLIIRLSRIQLLSMFFSALLSVLWSIHTAKHNFYTVEWTSVLASLLSFGFLVVFTPALGIDAAAWANAIRTFLQVAFLSGVLFPFEKPSFSSDKFDQIRRKMQPLIAGNIYYKTDILIDRHLTSKGAAGQLTLFNLAQQLYAVGSNILGKVLVNTMIPVLSKLFQQREMDTFRKPL